MRSLCFVVCFLAVTLLASNCAMGLEIRVAPETLVLSSPGGKLTVHTDVPFNSSIPVDLYVNGEEVGCYTFPDSCGNLVAQCTKASVKEAIGDFEGKWTKAVVAIDVLGEVESEEIRVKK